MTCNLRMAYASLLVAFLHVQSVTEHLAVTLQNTLQS